MKTKIKMLISIIISSMIIGILGYSFSTNAFFMENLFNFENQLTENIGASDKVTVTPIQEFDESQITVNYLKFEDYKAKMSWVSSEYKLPEKQGMFPIDAYNALGENRQKDWFCTEKEVGFPVNYYSEYYVTVGGDQATGGNNLDGSSSKNREYSTSPTADLNTNVPIYIDSNGNLHSTDFYAYATAWTNWMFVPLDFSFSCEKDILSSKDETSGSTDSGTVNSKEDKNKTLKEYLISHEGFLDIEGTKEGPTEQVGVNIDNAGMAFLLATRYGQIFNEQKIDGDERAHRDDPLQWALWYWLGQGENTEPDLTNVANAYSDYHDKMKTSPDIEVQKQNVTDISSGTGVNYSGGIYTIGTFTIPAYVDASSSSYGTGDANIQALMSKKGEQFRGGIIKAEVILSKADGTESAPIAVAIPTSGQKNYNIQLSESQVGDYVELKSINLTYQKIHAVAKGTFYKGYQYKLAFRSAAGYKGVEKYMRPRCSSNECRAGNRNRRTHNIIKYSTKSRIRNKKIYNKSYT